MLWRKVILNNNWLGEKNHFKKENMEREKRKDRKRGEKSREERKDREEKVKLFSHEVTM